MVTVTVLKVLGCTQCRNGSDGALEKLCVSKFFVFENILQNIVNHLLFIFFNL